MRFKQLLDGLTGTKVLEDGLNRNARALTGLPIMIPGSETIRCAVIVQTSLNTHRDTTIGTWRRSTSIHKPAGYTRVM
jgi:hypothetical protein